MVRKYENTTIRQKQIIDAARKIIVKYGSENLTVKKIAKEVGISETAVYRHYKSKRAILSILIDSAGETLGEDISNGIRKGNKSLEIMDNVLQGHLSAIEQRRGISFQVIAEIVSLGDKKLNIKLSKVIDTYTRRLQELLKEGVRSGEVREDIDLKAAAILIFGMVQGIVNIWALNNYSFDPLQKYVSLWSVFRRAIITR